MSRAVLYTNVAAALPMLHFAEPIARNDGMIVSIHSPSGPGLAIQLCRDGDSRLRSPGVKLDRDQRPESIDFKIENAELLKCLQDIDAFIPTVAYLNCKDWFKKPLSEAEILSLYSPILSTDKPGALRLKVDPLVKIWSCKGGVYREGELHDVEPSATFWANVNITDMWFRSREFGLSVTCTDILACPPERPVFPFQSNFIRAPEDSPDGNSSAG